MGAGMEDMARLHLARGKADTEADSMEVKGLPRKGAAGMAAQEAQMELEGVRMEVVAAPLHHPSLVAHLGLLGMAHVGP